MSSQVRTIRFRFNQARTEQAACRLLYRCGGGLTVLQLVKLLYFVDREALVRRSEPVTGDRMVSMDHGPVLSRTLNLINEDREHASEHEIVEWQHYVSPRDGNDIKPVAVEPTEGPALRAFYDELSRWELALIDEIADTYGGKTAGQLIDIGHKLPEWHAPGGTSTTIEPAEILLHAGRSQDEIEELKRLATESTFLQYATRAD
jgi:uncharacterized phage-associated protein